MVRTSPGREVLPRGGIAGCGVEVALSFPFADGPPSRGSALEEAAEEAFLCVPSLRWIAERAQGDLPGAATSRVHVGNESCERLLLSPRATAAWVSWAGSAGRPLSLVLPPLGVEEQEAAMASVSLLAGEPGAEVVANDWGTVHRVRERFPGARIVLGRLTHKTMRDPRIADRFDAPGAPAAARAALCGSGELAPGFRRLMERYRIGRREIDPFLQPLGEEEYEGRTEKLSVHLPWQFVTAGRACLPGSLHREREGKFLPGAPCREECRRLAVEFRLPLPDAEPGEGRSLLALGNALYHPVQPPILERSLALLRDGGRADRVVLTLPSAGVPSW